MSRMGGILMSLTLLLLSLGMHQYDVMATSKHHHHVQEGSNNPTTTTTTQQAPVTNTPVGPALNYQATIETSDTTSWSGSIITSKLGAGLFDTALFDINGSGSKSYFFPCQPMMRGTMKSGAYAMSVHIDTSGDNPPLLKVSALLNGQ